MKTKILSFFIALSLVNVLPTTAWATGQEEQQAKITSEEVIEDTSEDATVSLEEFLRNNEEMQAQIDEIRQLFEDNGYNIDGLNGNVENLNGEIDGLQMSLNDLYSLINTLQAQPKASNTSSSSSSGSTPQQATTAPTQTTTTTTTVTTAAPNTEPNGYLVEKAEKTPEERDFITVTTRDGHVFYIVIDYENDNQNVYFLNTVDTADLKYLLEGSSTTTALKLESDNKTTETEASKTEKDDTEKANDGNTKKKNSNMVLYIVGGVGVIVFIFIAKKKVSGGKKKFDDDDSENTSDDYTEEEPEIYENDETEESYEEE